MNLASMTDQPTIQTRAMPSLAVGMDLKDAPSGWAPVPGYPKWQVVPDPATPWDVDVVKAMRKLDPTLVPLWVTWAYKPPKRDASCEVFVTGRHAIGWHLPDLPSLDFNVLMPTSPIGGMTFKRPNRLWKIYHVSEETSQRIGGFVPWTWWQYYNLREEFREAVPEDERQDENRNRQGGHFSMKAYLEAKKAAMDVRKASLDAQQSYMRSQVEPFIQKKLDGVSDTLWKEWLSGGNKTAAPPKRIQIQVPGETR